MQPVWVRVAASHSTTAPSSVATAREWPPGDHASVTAARCKGSASAVSMTMIMAEITKSCVHWSGKIVTGTPVRVSG